MKKLKFPKPLLIVFCSLGIVIIALVVMGVNGVFHRHRYVAVVSLPTCTEEGYTVYTCDCGDTYTDDYTAPTGHTVVVDEAVPSTCISTGLTEGSHCSVCGLVFVEQLETDYSFHHYENGKCTVCGVDDPHVCEHVDENGASAWEILSETVETEDNATTRVTTASCPLCGTVMTETYVNTVSEFKETKTYQYLYEYIDETSETYEITEESSHTLTEEGRISNNTYTYSETYNYYTGTTREFSSCETRDYDYTDCSILYHYTDSDGKEETSTTVEHTEIRVIEGRAATCTETGVSDGEYCAVCGTVLKEQEEIPATGHTPAADPAKAATCTSAGYTAGSHCSVCGVVLEAQQKIFALGHTVVVDRAVAPSGSSNGLTEGSHCSVCGKVFKAQVSYSSSQSLTNADIHTSKQAAYVNGSYTDVLNYAKGYDSLDVPQPVTLYWYDLLASSSGSYYVEVSASSSYQSSVVYQTDETSIDIYNLLSNTVYYWRVAESRSALSSAKSNLIRITSSAPTMFKIDGSLNIRDAGGWKTTDGVEVKQGMLIRGSRLNGSYSSSFTNLLSETGMEQFKALGVKTIIDLRLTNVNETGDATASNMKSTYGVANYYSIPFVYSTPNLLTENSSQIKKVFAILADKNNYPVYFNCNVGTDRTGLIAYLVNGLLGVSQDDLRKDYLLSNFSYLEKTLSVGNLSYESTIAAFSGNTWAEKIENCLLSYGVTQDQIDSIRNILL